MNVLSDGRGTHYGTFSVLGCSKETHGNTMELKLERWHGIVCVYLCEWECDEFTIKKKLINSWADVCVCVVFFLLFSGCVFMSAAALPLWRCSLRLKALRKWFLAVFFRAEPQLLIISCRKPHFKGASLSVPSETFTRFVLCCRKLTESFGTIYSERSEYRELALLWVYPAVIDDVCGCFRRAFYCAVRASFFDLLTEKASAYCGPEQSHHFSLKK